MLFCEEFSRGDCGFQAGWVAAPLHLHPKRGGLPPADLRAGASCYCLNRMSDLVDLRDLLASWPYDPDHEARIVRGRDGREILQVRTPLGIEQFELDGRPDGLHPHGAESALAHHRQRYDWAKADGRDAGFKLSAGDCAELFNEGTLYYYRYLRLFQLRDWPRTLRDTGRNLQAFDFVRRHAARDEDRSYLEKWRPYLVRMNGAAAALQELEQGAHDRALECVNAAVQQIESLEDLDDETFQFERQRSLLALRELSEQIGQTRPVSRLELLERQLRRAVESQEFERAAELRDRIRGLRRESEAG